MSDWYLRDPAGATAGPYPTQTVVQWITAGQIGPQHAVCAVGTQQWVALTDVPMFFGALASARGPSSLQTPPAAPPAPPAPAPAAPQPPAPPVQMLLGGAAREPSAILPAPAPPTAPREPSGVIAMPQVAAKPKLLMGTMAVPALMEAELASIPRPPPPGPPGPTLASMKGRTMLGQMAFTPPTGGAAARMAVIGRAPGSDIVLAYPQVSTRHTGVAPTTDGMLAVTDLGSTNGTHVDGKRIPPGNPVKIKPGSRIFIGPYAINLGLENNEVRAWVDSDNADWSGNLVEIEALDLFLQVPDRENKAQNKVLLNHVTFKAHPGDLIALMGPSGAGKTTLLTVLNGYLVSAA